MAPSLEDKNQSEKRPVSTRKREANRQNAQKSTGPKTPRGKAWSSKNPLKHGLVAENISEVLRLMGEDPKEFHEIIEGLRQRYQPVDAAEELLVQRAAVCLRRLLRAGRYENAELCFAVNDSGLNEYESYKEMTEPFKTLSLLLGSAEEEIVTTGGLSQELKEKMFAVTYPFRGLWCELEEKAQEDIRQKKEEITFVYSEEPTKLFSVSLLEVRKMLSTGPDSEPSLSSVTAVATTRLAIGWLEHENRTAQESSNAIFCDSLTVPKAEVMDKLLRYKSAAERSFWRTLDMLERLQRRRKGEPVLPPVNVRLTQ